ncbi:MAG TPA: GFA family protein [Burkholderiales bacterium]|nr:GFA family protein [Burkholderiales bacterium]
MKITGKCLCGAVRWESSEAPIVTRWCWCRDCQYLGAGSGTVNAAFRTATFKIIGKPSDHLQIAESGNRMHREFCPTCGTPLFSAAESRPHLVFVRVGTFDDPDLAKPAMTIWTASAPSWACINEDLPRLEGQPPPAA